MNPITEQEANESLSKLLEDEDPPEQAPTPESNIPWQEKPPSSWVEFLDLMVRFAEYKGWVIDFDAEEMALAIFAHEEPVTDSAEVQQGGFSFKEDKFPF